MSEPDSDGGILMLAAGRSRRFGADKRRARLADGRSLLDASLDSALASGLPCLLCLAPGDDLTVRPGAARLHCAATAERGMGATLASGIGALRGWRFALVALADMPWIHPNTFCAIAAHAADDRIVIPVHRGRRGHPVAFGADFFPALAQLDGDVGARQLVAAHAAAVRELAVADAGILRDVDRPSDLCDQ